MPSGFYDLSLRPGAIISGPTGGSAAAGWFDVLLMLSAPAPEPASAGFTSILACVSGSAPIITTPVTADMVISWDDLISVETDSSLVWNVAEATAGGGGGPASQISLLVPVGSNATLIKVQ